MVAIHHEKKKGYEEEGLRIKPLLGRDKRIITIPIGCQTKLTVDADIIRLENDGELFWIKKQRGLYDEGIIITGDGK